jgi:hypothetical protein
MYQQKKVIFVFILTKHNTTTERPSMEAALLQDPKFQANLKKTKAVAMGGGVGYPHFMQVLRYPMGSLYVTKVSDEENNGVRETAVSMHVEGQGDNYPKIPGDHDAIHREGY